MIASDSPAVIDCPSHKTEGISSANSDLKAAIAKLRMTAYMWQAMIAEDMRLKGLGRRSFRLEDEWTVDTVSQDFYNAAQDYSRGLESALHSTAKVHVIRSSKPVQDIQDPDCAQQNPSASRQSGLLELFLEALKDANGPFASGIRPIVAGMILDSHYTISQDLVLGHASSHSCNAEGISLGMFGSYLAYSWPRFLEEVTACLTDIRAPGYKVGNNKGDCTTMWKACAAGQGAFLLEVGHAFGLPTRPRETEFSQNWTKHFLPKSVNSENQGSMDSVSDNESRDLARWDLADALALRMLPHFHLPGDPAITGEQRDAIPVVQVLFDQLGKTAFIKTLHISSYKDGIARVIINDQNMTEKTRVELVNNTRIPFSLSAAGLEYEFDQAQPLHLRVLGANGKETIVDDAWKLLAAKTSLRIADGTICLTKHSILHDSPFGGTHDLYEWAQLLREKGADGTVHNATWIDLRIRRHWDGGVITYSDGHTSHWGSMRHRSRTHHFGDSILKRVEIPVGVEITCIEVNKGCGEVLDGVRIHLSNGTVAGELNDNYDYEAKIVKLEPAMNQVIIGFFGKSEKKGFCGVVEFGIITAAKRVGWEGLPETIYDMPELKNMAGMDEENEVDDCSTN